MPNKCRNSPEYIRRLNEIAKELDRKGRLSIASYIMKLENAAKTAEKNEAELRKVVLKYQGIFGRLMEILTASTNVRRNGNGCAVERRGLNLPFNYEIAFKNCRVIIADYFEDLKILNPGGSYWNGGKRVAKECARKLERMRTV